MDSTEPAFGANLISESYLETQRWLHAQPRGYGGGGHKWAPMVASIATDMGYRTVLDYGCGQATLAEKLAIIQPDLEVTNFDPAIKEHAALPASADLVVCTDVLEHIEPERLDWVLHHLCGLADGELFAVISLKPANKQLPDGRNAHLIIEDAEWWRDQLSRFFDVGMIHYPSHRYRNDELVISCLPKPVRP